MNSSNTVLFCIRGSTTGVFLKPESGRAKPSRRATLPQPFSFEIPQGYGRVNDGSYFDFVLATLSEFKPPCQERLFRYFNTFFELRTVRLQHNGFVY
jgi:hypothetical protein